MKEIIKYGLILMIVCVIAAASLSYTYSKTQPLIDKRTKENSERMKKEVLSGVYSFEEINKGENIVYIGYDERGIQIGTVIETSAKGYGGHINMIIGIGNDNIVSGVNILNHLETPGLGAKIEDKEFIEQFKGKKAEKIVLKKDDSKGKIDAITAATISSRAVTNEVRKVTEIIGKTEGK